MLPGLASRETHRDENAVIRAHLLIRNSCEVRVTEGVLDIRSVGWDISGSIEFRDHHRFTPRDVRRIAAEAKAAGSMIVLTTEKDAVRLGACDLGELLIASVPLIVGVEPADGFKRWLLDRLRNLQSAINNQQVR